MKRKLLSLVLALALSLGLAVPALAADDEDLWAGSLSFGANTNYDEREITVYAQDTSSGNSTVVAGKFTLFEMDKGSVVIQNSGKKPKAEVYAYYFRFDYTAEPVTVQEEGKDAHEVQNVFYGPFVYTLLTDRTDIPGTSSEDYVPAADGLYWATLDAEKSTAEAVREYGKTISAEENLRVTLPDPVGHDALFEVCVLTYHPDLDKFYAATPRDIILKGVDASESDGTEQANDSPYELKISGPNGYEAAQVTEKYQMANVKAAYQGSQISYQYQNPTANSVTAWALPRGTDFTISGLELDENKSPLLAVSMNIQAWSDPDGDGIYEARLFTGGGDDGASVVPVTEKGPFADTKDKYYTEREAIDVFHGSLQPQVKEDSSSSASVTYSASRLEELLGPNTLLLVNVTERANWTEVKATYTFLLTGEDVLEPEPEPEEPAVPATAAPTAAPVLVNGETTAFDAYEINDNNYFKLRDLAYVLNGTDKQFEVTWDAAANAIVLTSGKAYTAVGGEMSSKGAGNQTAEPTTSKILLDGKEVALTAYEIGGNNYFKLRDIGAAFDFGVDWDAAAGTIRIDTSKGYTPN